jgi:hypothetical protein
VVVLRRPLRGEALLADESQGVLGFVEANVIAKRYEYAVLVTDLKHELLTIAQLYRDRGDAENTFDEVKNQWGWGGFTTQDLARCRLSALAVALVYNWWSLFVRLGNPKARLETITSRPFCSLQWRARLLVAALSRSLLLLSMLRPTKQSRCWLASMRSSTDSKMLRSSQKPNRGSGSSSVSIF